MTTAATSFYYFHFVRTSQTSHTLHERNSVIYIMVYLVWVIAAEKNSLHICLKFEREKEQKKYNKIAH